MSELPEGWAIEELSELTTKIVDGSHNPPPGVGVGEPMLSARNIEGGRINFDSYRLITPEAFEREDARTAVAPDDVLLTIVGTIGRSAVVPLGHPRFSLQRSVAVLRPNGSITPHYIRHYLQAYETQQWMLERAKGTAQKGIYLGALAKLPCLVPPVAEQRRIVAKLDALAARTARARADLDRIPALAARYKQTVLARLLDGAEAEMVPLEAVVASGVIGLVRSKNQQSEVSGQPYIRMQHYDLDGRWNAKGLTGVQASNSELERFSLRSGDVLFNTRNSSELVGKVALCGRQHEGSLYNNNLLRLRFCGSILPSFAFRYMQSPQFRSHLEGQKSATTSVAAIYQSTLYKTPFWMPPIAKQNEIVQRIDHALAEIDRLAAEAACARRLLDRLDQSVLAKAFRGELVPQDPADEPARALIDRIRAERAAAPKAKRGRKSVTA